MAPPPTAIRTSGSPDVSATGASSVSASKTK